MRRLVAAGVLAEARAADSRVAEPGAAQSAGAVFLLGQDSLALCLPKEQREWIGGLLFG
jgi:hypothetical protein